MKRKLLSILALLCLAVTGAWADQEMTPNEGGGKDSEIKKTSYTLPGSCNPDGGYNNSSWNNRYMKKVRTNQTLTIGGESKSNCFYITVNEGYKITGVSLYLTTNKEKTTEGTNSIVATYYDDVTYASDLSTDVAVKGASSPTNISISGISATSRVVWQFSTSNQVNIYGTIYYEKITKTVSGETLKTSGAVKVGSTSLVEDAATNGYAVDGSIITLTDDQAVASAPSNIKLVKTVTYSDESTEDVDVDVTFDEIVTDGYYIGTASIDGTTYTVKVKQNTETTLVISAASVDITSTGYKKGTATFTVSGANLSENVSVSLPATTGLSIDKDAITISDGVAAETTFTLSYFNLAAASGSVDITIASGSLNETVTVNYTSTAYSATALADVTESTTWDFSKVTTTDNIPAAAGYVTLSDHAAFTGLTTNNIAVSGLGNLDVQFRNKSAIQGAYFKFHTTVAGTVTVKFSDVGSSTGRPARYANVNGTRSDVSSNSSNTTVTCSAITVEAGDVIIKGEQAGDTYSDNQIRVFEIVFTATPATVAVTGVELDEETASIEVGETVTLTATVTPSNATNQNVSWSSDNTDVATVDEDGVVTGVAAGTANITVTTEDGNFTDVCVVTVTAATPVISVGGDLTFDYSTRTNDNYADWTQSPINIKITNGNGIDSNNKFIKIKSNSNLGIAITATDALITDVVFTYQDTNRLPNTITADDNTELTTSGKTQTWLNTTGKASVEFTLEGSPRLTQIAVTYASKAATLNTSGYGTFSFGADVELLGVNAYTAALDLDKEKITCTKIANGQVPAGAGVLLYGDASANVYAKSASNVSDLSDNNLKGTTNASGETVEKGSNTYYVLSGDSFVTFDGTAFTANKAYFEVSSGTVLARNFSIVFDDEATGINEMQTMKNVENGKFYNLNGQQIAQPTKGLYIVNGKKYIVK